MKKLNEILFVTEEISEEGSKWFVSFILPTFQGGDTREISEEDAIAVMGILNSKLNNTLQTNSDDYKNTHIN